MITITIGRLSGPSNDVDAKMDIEENQLPLVKDVLAAVNLATGNKESWFIFTDEHGTVIPLCK